MKRSEFTVSARRTVQAVFGRSLSDVPSAYPDLFRKADKVCLVFGSGAPRSLEVRTLRLFPDRRNAYFRFRLPFSEKAKTMEQAAGLCSFLFGKGFSRDSLLIAAGGGAVTDLSGFAASIYMRGMNWVSVPTTFLGQIDAGLGGKPAVNLGGA
ncbi:MAG TPA: hypothetical protein PL037_10050, partial [Elusimicrobiales bacterium]|nr:hypothetical protein [Elusimicrobiales bacterium]